MTFAAWRTVFLTGSGVYLFGLVVYVLFIRHVLHAYRVTQHLVQNLPLTLM